MKNTIAFIDGSNIHATAKALGFEIDYAKLHKLLKEKFKVQRILYFTAVLENSEFNSLYKLVDYLSFNGFTVISKEAKEYTTPDGRRRIKGNMDIEMAVHALKLAPYTDHFILFSGDGDFSFLIEALQSQGIFTTVISSMMTNPPMIAENLRKQADATIELGNLKQLLVRER